MAQLRVTLVVLTKFFIFCIFRYIQTTICTGVQIKYGYENPILRGRDITSQMMSMTSERSVIDCLRKCSITINCTSFSYSNDVVSCRLYDSVSVSIPGGVPIRDGWKNFIMTDATITVLCPNGWREHSGSCYLFEDFLLETWVKAKINCESHGGYLVEIESITEHVFVRSVASTLNQSAIGTTTVNSVWGYWIGGNDISKEGIWLWSESGNPVRNISWKPYEPNNAGDEDCMIIMDTYGYNWVDYLCDQKQNFICEKPMN